MSDKRGNSGVRAVGAIAAFAAAYGARKLITLGWKTVTGKEPPSDPQDPQVGLGEALGWAVLTGVGTETARLLATRATTRKARRLASQDGQ